jgi:hypothetical protein
MKINPHSDGYKRKRMRSPFLTLLVLVALGVSSFAAQIRKGATST